jgi:hypothetical protein
VHVQRGARYQSFGREAWFNGCELWSYGSTARCPNESEDSSRHNVVSLHPSMRWMKLVSCTPARPSILRNEFIYSSLLFLEGNQPLSGQASQYKCYMNNQLSRHVVSSLGRFYNHTSAQQWLRQARAVLLRLLPLQQLPGSSCLTAVHPCTHVTRHPPSNSSRNPLEFR